METIQDVVSKVVEDHLFALTERIEQQWSATDKGEYTAHDITLRRYTPSKNMVRLGLDFEGLGAFILEYGSGSLMVTNSSTEIGDLGNPDVSDYMNSSWFNNARTANGNAITGRDKGDIIHSPERGGKDTKSSGKLYGKNLEKPLPRKNPKAKPLPPLEPQEPLHIVEEEVFYWCIELEDAINEAVDEWLMDSIEGCFKGANA